MTRNRKGQTGSTMLEFVLVGIAMIFMLICLFEIGRGMWAYHTLAYAVREGTRYAAMHGKGCASPNTCGTTIGGIITYMQNAGGGFDPGNTTLTFSPQSGTATSDTITNLVGNTTPFPPAVAYAPGNRIQISSKYKFKSMLGILYFGATAGNTFYLTASSQELIQF
jgi:Flp pilus assembly protein TadG